MSMIRGEHDIQFGRIVVHCIDMPACRNAADAMLFATHQNARAFVHALSTLAQGAHPLQAHTPGASPR